MSNLTLNRTGASSAEVEYSQVILLIIAFLCCCMSVVNNGIVLIVTRKVQKFPLLEILGVANLVFALTYVIASPARITMQFTGTYHEKVPNWQCFLHPWVWLYDVGNYWPATVTLFIGMERVAAACYPLWYKANYDRLKPRVTRLLKVIMGLQLIPTFASVLLGSLNGRMVERQMTWSQCTGHFGQNYHLATNIYLISCNAAAMVLSIVAPEIAKRHMTGRDNDDFSILQRKLAKTAIAMVTCTCILVIIPNIFRAMERVHVLEIGEYRRGFTALFVLNGAVNLFIYYDVITDFRNATRRFIFKRSNLIDITPAAITI